LALWSIVLGILGMAAPNPSPSWIPFTVCGVLGAVCGHCSLWQNKRAQRLLSMRVGAVFGLVLSYGGLLDVQDWSAIYALRHPARMTLSIKQAQQIGIACLNYAWDNNGKFPIALDALAPAYVEDRKYLADPGQPQNSEPGYIYFGAGRSKYDLSDPPGYVLIVSKALYGRRRVVVLFDGSALRLADNELPEEVLTTIHSHQTTP